MKTRQVTPSPESRSPSEIGDEEGEEMEEPVLCENVNDVYIFSYGFHPSVECKKSYCQWTRI